MNSKNMNDIKAIKYFNNLNPSEIKNIPEDDIQSLNEKMKLEFSIKNAKEGTKYSISAHLLDRKIEDFKSEEKKPHTDNSISFEQFYVCDYYFEKEQKIQIKINRNKSSITVDTSLGGIIGSRQSTFIQKYDGEETLIIKADKMGKSDSLINIKFVIKKNGEDSDYFKDNKLIYIISCKDSKIYSSEAINDKGEFNSVEVPTCLLQPYYTVNFYNYYDQLISSFNKTIDEVKNSNKDDDSLQLKIPIANNSFLFLYDNSEIKEDITFLDYISAGVRIGLSIGIDFTGSNGHPLDEGTLHCIKTRKPNDYEKAIKACGDIVAQYDYDQLFPVYGFGAIVNSSKSKEASMCFNLNFEENPEINKIDNIIKVYRECLKKDKLTFAGPTEFAPIINTVISSIKSKTFDYHILMILTDGVIDDLQQTIDALVEASFEPISIIIIGIGNADFKKMEILDGDDVPLVSSNGKKRMRDLVQFVPFSKFKNDAKKLSEQVLEEIPNQIVDYYTSNNMTPEKIRKLISQKNNEVPNMYPDLDEPLYVNNINNSNSESNNNKINNKGPSEIHVSLNNDNESKTYTNQPPSNYKYVEQQNLPKKDDQIMTNLPPDEEGDANQEEIENPYNRKESKNNFSLFNNEN